MANNEFTFLTFSSTFSSEDVDADVLDGVAGSNSGKSQPSGQEEAYVRERVLGKGAFGQAVLYRKTEDNSHVVWKEISVGVLDARARREAQNEIEVLSMFDHVNVVAYYNHFLDGKTLLIEMEYANGGSLYHWLGGRADRLLSQTEALWFFCQLGAGVQHVHNHGVLHRDIKTLNIFLTRAGVVKLGDFGISRMMETEEMASSCVGTPYYMSPEIIKGLKYNHKSDMWAIGCVFFEILTLQRTFDGSNALRVASEIVNGVRLDIDPRYSDTVRLLLDRLLSQDPDSRPSADEMMDAEPIKSVAVDVLAKVRELQASSTPVRPSSGGSEIIPVITSKTTEVYQWGAGKLLPQRNEFFGSNYCPLQVAVGEYHIAAITSEKELFTWTNAHGNTELCGQLGHSSNASHRTPKKVEALDGQPIREVCCGEDFTLCVSYNGAVYAFGSNYYGCLGMNEDSMNEINGNDDSGFICVPSPISALSTVNVVSISCGQNHAMVLASDGAVYTWGVGEFGRLGSGSEDDLTIPTRVNLSINSQDVRRIFAAYDRSFLVTTCGKVLACGSNEHNKLGFNNSPKGISTSEGKSVSFDVPCQTTFRIVKPLSHHHVEYISGGEDHTAVLDSFQQIIMFGSNRYGQLGVGHYKRHSGMCVLSRNVSGKRFTKITCGDTFTIAATSDCHVYAWGNGADGRLGYEMTDNSGSGPNGRCNATPRPIFGALHMVAAMSAHSWFTVIVAERVLETRSVRSRPLGAAVNAETNGDAAVVDSDYHDALTEVLGAPLVATGESSIVVPRASADAVDSIGVRTLTLNDSNVPDWLKEELDQSVIPLERQQLVPQSATTEASGPTSGTTECSNCKVKIDQLMQRISDLEAENTALRAQVNSGVT